MADIALTAAQIAVVYPDQAEIITMICGAAITAGQAVYQIAASGKAGVADANDAGKQQIRGIALEGGGAGQAISVLVKGHVYGFTISGLNYDAALYLSDTAGALADAAGTLSVNAGRVAAIPDKDMTKVLYFEADWLRTWA